MIAIRVPADRLFMYQGSFEDMASGLRAYRDQQVLSWEARAWFLETRLEPKYELDELVVFGRPWSATFYFSSEREATLFKLTFG